MGRQDFSDFERWINRAAEEFKRTSANGFSNVKISMENIAREFKEYQAKANAENTSNASSAQQEKREDQPNTWQPSPPTKIRKRSIPGKISGVLFTVFGWIGAVSSGLTWLSLIASGFLTGEPTLTIGSTIIVLPIFLAFILMIIRGCYLLTRVKRFRRYQELLCGSEFCLIEHLAAFTGQTPSFVVKDMKKMIRIGMFQEVFLDDQEICLMLDRETYQQYLNLQKKKVQQEQQEQRMPPIDSNNEKPNALIAEGKAYIQKIHEANDAIPGEEISAKLFQLEDITSKVFGVVVQHPEKESAIQNFMNYYLPTTLKLVNAYRNFDERQVSGEEISYAKSEISHILDTINLAFENLLSSLYQDDILDITADIATLEKVLAQDGLTGTEFKTPLQEEPKNY